MAINLIFVGVLNDKNYKNNKKIKKLFSKLELYIVRINENNDFRYSAPCYNCMEIIKILKIKKIIFTTDDDIFIIKPQLFNNTHITHGFRNINTF